MSAKATAQLALLALVMGSASATSFTAFSAMVAPLDVGAVPTTYTIMITPATTLQGNNKVMDSITLQSDTKVFQDFMPMAITIQGQGHTCMANLTVDMGCVGFGVIATLKPFCLLGGGMPLSFNIPSAALLPNPMPNPGATAIGLAGSSSQDTQLTVQWAYTPVAQAHAYAIIGRYPGYTGPLNVQGTYGLTSTVDQFISFLGAVDGLEVSKMGGWHIHVGTNCNDANTVGAHFFPHDATDKWLPNKWTSDATGTATIKLITSSLGLTLTLQEALGHVIVVHDSNDVRIGCGVIHPAAALTMAGAGHQINRRQLVSGADSTTSVGSAAPFVMGISGMLVAMVVVVAAMYAKRHTAEVPALEAIVLVEDATA